MWDLVKALEKEAAYYSDVLQGLQPAPPSEAWPSLTERYQQLQAKVEQQQAQEQGVQPAQLEQKLAAGLEPCQVCVCVCHVCALCVSIVVANGAVVR